MTMKPTTWNKLVRDRIPEIIAETGEAPIMRTLEPDEFVAALKDKVVEEAREVATAASRDALMMELADLTEVVDALVRAVGLDAAEIKAIRQQRAHSRGGFDKRVLLIETRCAG